MVLFKQGFSMFFILFIASVMICFKLSVKSDCGKWMEMGQVMATNLTLTLSLGWNMSCNNVVTQTVTSFDYSFSSKSMDFVEVKKMLSVKIISDIYLQFQYNCPTFTFLIVNKLYTQNSHDLLFPVVQKFM